jgi:hypothetical protein
MTFKRWPILDLDGDATEAEIRRAYAQKLRERRPDDDPIAFADLRAEYQAALARVAAPKRPAAPRLDVASPAPGMDPASPVSALGEIRGLLIDGELRRACERYDRARAFGEIGFADERAIEEQLARSFLIDGTLTSDELYELARHYGWDDALGRFPLGEEVIAKCRPAVAAREKPGSKYIGQWNWGAFFFPGLWLMKHGRRGGGTVLIIVMQLVLSANIVVYAVLFLWLAVRCGREANGIAVLNRRFRDDAQFAAVQNRWRNWSAPFYLVWLICEMYIFVVALRLR